MSEDEVFKHGGALFPLDVDTTRSSLRDADPTVHFALEFLEHCIEKYAGERIVWEARLAQVDGIRNAVGSTLPWDPSGYLDTTQFRFPILALYRRSTELSDKTIAFRHDTSTLELAYILPPLTGAQFDGMIPMLSAVKSIVDRCVEKGWDPTYTPTEGVIGEQAWQAKHAGLESIEVRTASFGEFPGTGELNFPAVTFGIIAKERASSGDVDGAYPAFTGPDLRIDFQPTEGDVVPDVADQNVTLIGA